MTILDAQSLLRVNFAPMTESEVSKQGKNEPGKPRRRKWILPVAVLIAAIIGLAIFRSVDSDEPAAAQQGRGGGGGGGGTAVRTIVAKTEVMEDRIFLNGSLIANESVEIRPETGGRVVEIGFEEGALVEEDALLIRIDDRELKSMLASASQRQKFAETEFQRQETLLSSGGATQAIYDSTLNELELAKAEVELITTRLDRMELRAPFPGRVGLRYVSPGALVDSTTVITTLQQTDVLKVDFPVPERYLSTLRVGMAISLGIAGMEEKFQGEVAAIEPRIDQETRTVTLRALVDNKDGALLPGGFASIELVLERSDDAILVPSIALRPGMDRDVLYLVVDGKAEQREVTIGTRTSDRVRIVDGLAPGEEVIVDGVQSVRPGQPVRVFNRTAEARTAQRG